MFAIDVTVCRTCGGRMRILEVVDTPDAVARVLHGARAPPRPPPPGQLVLLHGRAPPTATRSTSCGLVTPPDATAQEFVPFVTHRRSPSSPRPCDSLFEVMNGRLAEVPYLAGDYSIADMATWPWVTTYEWSGSTVDGLEHLQRWLRDIGERPAVVRGARVPENDAPSRDKLVQDVRDNLLV